MGRVVGLLVLVLAGFSAVQADFGLNLTIPGFASGISGAINQGVVTLIKANGTIKMDPEMDVSGALGTLIKVSNNVISPMNKLLGATLSAGSNKKTNSQTLFAGLSTLVTNTKAAIAEALTTSDDLQSSVRVSEYDAVHGNVSLIATSLDQLKDGLTVLSTTVAVVQDSKEPVTSQNVSTFFTADVTNGVIYPLSNISKAIDSLAAVVHAVSKDRIATANAIATTNSTINSGMRSLASTATNFNKTVSDASSTATNNANNLNGQIIQQYSAITKSPQNYNGGNISSLVGFLTNVSAEIDNLNGNLTASFNSLLNTVTTNLNTQIDSLTELLLNATNDLSRTAYTSSSVYVDSCTPRYLKQLTQNPLLINRLGTCLQSEQSSFRDLNGMLRTLLDQTRNLAGSVSASTMSRQCTAGMNECVATYFAYFGDLSQHVSDKLTANGQIIARETTTIQNRIRACTAAIAADIADNARTVQAKFSVCLETGTRRI